MSCYYTPKRKPSKLQGKLTTLYGAEKAQKIMSTITSSKFKSKNGDWFRVAKEAESLIEPEEKQIIHASNPIRLNNNLEPIIKPIKKVETVLSITPSTKITDGQIKLEKELERIFISLGAKPEKKKHNHQKKESIYDFQAYEESEEYKQILASMPKLSNINEQNYNETIENFNKSLEDQLSTLDVKQQSIFFSMLTANEDFKQLQNISKKYNENRIKNLLKTDLTGDIKKLLNSLQNITDKSEKLKNNTEFLENVMSLKEEKDELFEAVLLPTSSLGGLIPLLYNSKNIIDYLNISQETYNVLFISSLVALPTLGFLVGTAYNKITQKVKSIFNKKNTVDELKNNLLINLKINTLSSQLDIKTVQEKLKYLKKVKEKLTSDTPYELNSLIDSYTELEQTLLNLDSNTDISKIFTENKYDNLIDNLFNDINTYNKKLIKQNLQPLDKDSLKNPNNFAEALFNSLMKPDGKNIRLEFIYSNSNFKLLNTIISRSGLMVLFDRYGKENITREKLNNLESEPEYILGKQLFKEEIVELLTMWDYVNLSNNNTDILLEALSDYDLNKALNAKLAERQLTLSEIMTKEEITLLEQEHETNIDNLQLDAKTLQALIVEGSLLSSTYKKIYRRQQSQINFSIDINNLYLNLMDLENYKKEQKRQENTNRLEVQRANSLFKEVTEEYKKEQLQDFKDKNLLSNVEYLEYISQETNFLYNQLNQSFKNYNLNYKDSFFIEALSQLKDANNKQYSSIEQKINALNQALINVKESYAVFEKQINLDYIQAMKESNSKVYDKNSPDSIYFDVLVKERDVIKNLDKTQYLKAEILNSNISNSGSITLYAKAENILNSIDIKTLENNLNEKQQPIFILNNSLDLQISEQAKKNNKAVKDIINYFKKSKAYLNKELSKLNYQSTALLKQYLKNPIKTIKTLVDKFENGKSFYLSEVKPERYLIKSILYRLEDEEINIIPNEKELFTMVLLNSIKDDLGLELYLESLQNNIPIYNISHYQNKINDNLLDSYDNITIPNILFETTKQRVLFNSILDLKQQLSEVEQLYDEMAETSSYKFPPMINNIVEKIISQHKPEYVDVFLNNVEALPLVLNYLNYLAKTESKKYYNDKEILGMYAAIVHPGSWTQLESAETMYEVKGKNEEFSFKDINYNYILYFEPTGKVKAAQDEEFPNFQTSFHMFNHVGRVVSSFDTYTGENKQWSTLPAQVFSSLLIDKYVNKHYSDLTTYFEPLNITDSEYLELEDVIDYRNKRLLNVDITKLNLFAKTTTDADNKINNALSNFDAKGMFDIMFKNKGTKLEKELKDKFNQYTVREGLDYFSLQDYKLTDADVEEVLRPATGSQNASDEEKATEPIPTNQQVKRSILEAIRTLITDAFANVSKEKFKSFLQGFVKMITAPFRAIYNTVKTSKKELLILSGLIATTAGGGFLINTAIEYNAKVPVEIKIQPESKTISKPDTVKADTLINILPEVKADTFTQEEINRDSVNTSVLKDTIQNQSIIDSTKFQNNDTLPENEKVEEIEIEEVIPDTLSSDTTEVTEIIEQSEKELKDSIQRQDSIYAATQIVNNNNIQSQLQELVSTTNVARQFTLYSIDSTINLTILPEINNNKDLQSVILMNYKNNELINAALVAATVNRNLSFREYQNLLDSVNQFINEDVKTLSENNMNWALFNILSDSNYKLNRAQDLMLSKLLTIYMLDKLSGTQSIDYQEVLKAIDLEPRDGISETETNFVNDKTNELDSKLSLQNLQALDFYRFAENISYVNTSNIFNLAREYNLIPNFNVDDVNALIVKINNGEVENINNESVYQKLVQLQKDIKELQSKQTKTNKSNSNGLSYLEFLLSALVIGSTLYGMKRKIDKDKKEQDEQDRKLQEEYDRQLEEKRKKWKEEDEAREAEHKKFKEEMAKYKKEDEEFKRKQEELKKQEEERRKERESSVITSPVIKPVETPVLLSYVDKAKNYNSKLNNAFSVTERNNYNNFIFSTLNLVENESAFYIEGKTENIKIINRALSYLYENSNLAISVTLLPNEPLIKISKDNLQINLSQQNEFFNMFSTDKDLIRKSAEDKMLIVAKEILKAKELYENQEAKELIEKCNPKAQFGFSSSSGLKNWSLADDLAGEPSHRQGGVDIKMNGLDVEAEGGELVLRSDDGTMAVIPKYYRTIAKGYLNTGNQKELNKIINTLPKA